MMNSILATSGLSSCLISFLLYHARSISILFNRRTKHKTSDEADKPKSEDTTESSAKPASIVCPVCSKFFPTKGFLKWHKASAHSKAAKGRLVKVEVEPKVEEHAQEEEAPKNQDSVQ